MQLDIQWSLFATEIGLVILGLSCLVIDLFLKDDNRRGQTLAKIGMIGIAVLTTNLFLQWGKFGTTLNGTFVQDGVAWFFKLLFLLAGFFTLFMAREYQSQLVRGHGEFTLLILFSQVGISFLASANDFLLFFVALETLTVSLYVMTAYLRDKDSSIEAGVKYLILGALSTAVFLFGLSFVYGAAGSTSYSVIQNQLLSAGQSPPVHFLFGVILITASLGFKIAAVPFHLWVPDVYQGAPTPVTAYLAIGSKAAGFAAFVRLLLTVFIPVEDKLTIVLSVLAGLTMFYGNLGAIPQTNIKRLLGYSSIGHAGYLLIGLAAFSHSGKEALLFYLLSYLISTAGAFLVIIALSRHLKTEEISEFAGLSQKSPLLAAGMLLSLLSLAGLPPLAGFFAKFYILWASVKAGLLWLAFIGIVNVAPSLYYYLKVVKAMYVDKPGQGAPIRVTLDQKMIQYFCIFGILLLGVYQGPFVKLAEAAFSALSK